MAERYTCVRHRLLARFKPYERGLVVGIIQVIHSKILDGTATRAEVQRDGVALDRHDLLLIGGGERPSRTRDRCVRVLDQNGPHLGQPRATSGPPGGAISVTVVWPNFEKFCLLREKRLAVIPRGKRPSESESNQYQEQAHLRAPQEEAERKEEDRRLSEDFDAVVQEFSRLGLEVDQSALVREFPEARQQAKGRGKVWFVEQARAGRWRPEGGRRACQ